MSGPYALRVTLPPATSARVVLPAEWGAELLVTLDGARATPVRRDERLELEVGAGVHELRATRRAGRD